MSVKIKISSNDTKSPPIYPYIGYNETFLIYVLFYRENEGTVIAIQNEKDSPYKIGEYSNCFSEKAFIITKDEITLKNE